MQAGEIATMQGREVGSWRLDRQLGAGGMGTVYLASHRALDSPAAVKVLSPLLSGDPKFRERFFREARAQAQLRHPHVAQVLDYLEQDGSLFLVVEYLPGGSLTDYMERERPPLPVATAVTWARQALSALDYAHQHGVIHRDVKPSNIMLDAQARVRVVDFGIALVLDRHRLTSTGGGTLGTPQYMSPEQIRHPQAVDHRTDVYSMGIVLYELLAGRVPFDADSDFDVRHAQVHSPPKSLREQIPSIPKDLDDAVLKALAKDPADRYAGCGELGRALARFAGAGEPAAPAATPGGAAAAGLGGAGVTAPAGASAAAAAPATTPKTAFLESAKVAWTVTALLAVLLIATFKIIGDKGSRLSGEQYTSSSLVSDLNSVKSELGQASSRVSSLESLLQARTWPLLVFDGFDGTAPRLNWPVGTASSKLSNLNETITGGKYRVTATAKEGFLRPFVVSGELRDFLASVEVQRLDDFKNLWVGLVLRRSPSGYYVFEVNGESYAFESYDETSKKWHTLSGPVQSSAIQATKPNVLSVIAQGPEFRLFINNQQLDSVKDATFSSGRAGVALELQPGKTVSATFDNFELRVPGH
jgi:hypothetical protein